MVVPPALAIPSPFALHAGRDRILGPRGQEVLLRGINANALVQYNPRHPEAVALTAGSVREMAVLGFDVVRLPISLSRLEPAPGRISHAYLDDVARIVHLARQNGLWVVIDLHQDRYSRLLFNGEADGLAAWAIKDFALPRAPVLFGLTNPAVQAAFTAFWWNRRASGTPLWSAYDQALAALGRRFAGEPAVAGYDILNEPNPGFLLGRDFRGRHLLPFYRQAIGALRRADPAHIAFVEPDLEDAALGYAPWPRASVPGKNLVYAPHIYLPTGVVGATHGLPPRVRADAVALALIDLYARIERGARAMGMPLWVGEFGVPPSPAGDRQIAVELSRQNRAFIGSAFWLWQILPSAYPWQVVEPNGALAKNTQRARLLAGPHALVIGGREQSMAYQAGSGTFTLRYRGDAAAGPTVVAASSLSFPNGMRVESTAPYRLLATKLAIPGRVLTGWRVVLRPTHGDVTLTLKPDVRLTAPGRKAAWP